MTSTTPVILKERWRNAGLRDRPFARSVAGVAGANVLIAVAGSLGGLVLARSLGPAARGDLVTIVIWPAMAGSVAALGTTEATCYLVARSARTDGPAIVATSTAAAVVTGLVVAAIGFGLAPLISRSDEVTSLLRFVFALSPAYIAAGVMTSTLQARHITRWNVARGIQPMVYLAGIAALAALGRLTLATAVLTLALGQLSQLLTGCHLVRRTVGGWAAPERSRLDPLYAYGVRSWMASVPRIVNLRLDQLILSVLPSVSAAALGNYAVAASLSWLALPLATAFGSVAFPSVAGADTDATARRLERMSLLGAAVTATAATAVITAGAALVVPVLFGRGFGPAVVALWFLAPGTVFLALNQVLGDLVRGRGKPLVVSTAEGIGAIITLVLLLLLIPPFGINGAAIASSVAYATVAALLGRSLHGIRRSAALAPEGSDR